MSSQRHFVGNTGGSRDGASPLRQRLKRETAALHRRLEAQLGLLEPELSTPPLPPSAPNVLWVLPSGRSRPGAAGGGVPSPRLPAAGALRANRASISWRWACLGASSPSYLDASTCHGCRAPRTWRAACTCSRALALGGRSSLLFCADDLGWPRAAAPRSSSATPRAQRRDGCSCSPGSKAWCALAREASRSSTRRARRFRRSRDGWSGRELRRHQCRGRRRDRPDRL